MTNISNKIENSAEKFLAKGHINNILIKNRYYYYYFLGSASYIITYEYIDHYNYLVYKKFEELLLNN